MYKSNRKTAIPLLVYIILAICSGNIAAQISQNKHASANIVSLANELKPFYDFRELPVYLDSTFSAQTSTYDPTGGNDDGFSGRYSFLRKWDEDHLVIFDAKGPGVINRFWTPTPSSDSLDFYIDDTLHPAFSIQYLDLFSGKQYPFVAPLCGNQLGGYYCYLPIPYQQRCIIVYRGKVTQFHQIGYRLYPHGAAVKNFNPRMDTDEKVGLEKVKILWNSNEPGSIDLISMNAGDLQKEESRFEIQPGQTHHIFRSTRGGRILGIALEPESAFESLSKNMDIKITWDNATYPAVYCPVADFFGYAFGKHSMQSLLIGATEKASYCHFPMPFDKSATIELIYRQPLPGYVSPPVSIKATILYSFQPRNPIAEGKFYACWNHEVRVPANHPHVFLNAGGKGHYVGTVLQADGWAAGMTIFFEGDDSTVIDGTLRMHGTGSEDYFNGGWYALADRWDGAFSLPLSGCLEYSLPYSRTGGYRLFLSDKMSFNKNILHTIEHGPQHNEVPASYTSVAFYYCDTPPAAMYTPVAEQTLVNIPDTLVIYPQLMNFNGTGNFSLQRKWAFPTGGESYIYSANEETGIRISLQEIPEGTYRVFLDYVKLPEGCAFSLFQRQTPLTGWIDGYSEKIQRIEQEYLCTIPLNPNLNSLTIRLKPELKKTQFMLNRIIFVRSE